MKGFRVLFVVALLSVTLFSVLVASREPRVAMEFAEPIMIPEGWVQTSKPLASGKATFLIALNIRNAEEMFRVTLDVSDPKSPNYGKHWKREAISELSSPSSSDVGQVREWLLSHGVLPSDIELVPRGDWIRFSAHFSTVEKLLECQFSVFHHVNSNNWITRTRSYSLPLSISKLVSFVGGTIRFPKIPKKLSDRRRSSNEPEPDANVNPAVIKSHYNITDEGVSSSNLQSVNQFLEQYYSPNDLTDFFKTFNLPDNAVTKVVGPNKANDPGDEASLDIQYIMGVATNVPTWFVYTPGNDNGKQEPFLEWITALANTQGAPWVNSVSYGDVESSISDSYLNRMEFEFAAVGAMGLSILYASGDDGTGCNRCSSFIPDWPASSAFVTTVGGTQMSGGTEVAVGFSGGGFSDYFSRPAYQETAVSNYLNSGKVPPIKYYNSSSRGYPDIAAFATNFEVVIGGQLEAVDGTSCAAPTASGIFALLNDIRLQNGKSVLGFLNPLLYSITTPGALHDITEGNNGSGCCPGFDAAPGWDPITGLGSPNYGILKQVVMSLP